MILFHNIIFGPVQSRRLGVSLGVNLLPDQGKHCNFDCIYCECGWNADNRNDTQLPTREQVQQTLERKLREMRQQHQLPNAITFSGNGEPTLHPQFADIVADTLTLRNHYAPSTKVCVLSNATTLANNKTIQALQKIDKPILKIDSAVETTVHLINQPQGTYAVAEVIKQMQHFHGAFTLQTLFLRGVCNGHSVDNTTPEEVRQWLNMLQLLQPREIMIYTIHRDTPSQTLQKLTEEELNAIAQQVETINTWCAAIQVAP